ncbi:MAG: hypothetical protein ACTHMT_14210 [Verrucomicrobiota bacterium]
MKVIVIVVLVVFGISCSIRTDRWSEEDGLVIASYSDPKAIEALLKLGERHKSAQTKLGEATLVRIAELCKQFSISDAVGLVLKPENATNRNELKLYYYQEALKLNPNCVEALNGICTYSRDTNELQLRLDQWKQADPSNSLPYYLKASIVIDYDKPKAIAELMKGNSLNGIIYRPLYEKFSKRLSPSEIEEARAEFYLSDFLTSVRFIMLQMKLTANKPSPELLLGVLIFDNQICRSIPSDPLNLARGALKGLGVLQSLKSYDVLSDREIQSEYDLRTQILHQVREKNLSESTNAMYMQSIAKSTMQLQKLLLQ